MRLATVLLIGTAAALWTVPAMAQSGAQSGAPATAVQPKVQPRPAAQTAAQTPGKAAPKAAEGTASEGAPKTDGTTQLRQRIDQLEEQITEMHVAVGTLESFAKSSAGRASSSPPASGGGGALSNDAAARIDGMETKLRALSSQIEQMTQQMRALEARGGGGPAGRSPAAPQQRGDAVGGDGGTDRGADRGERVAVTRGGEPPAAERPDAIGGLIRGPGSDRSADVGSAPLPPVGGAGGAAGGARQQPASLTTGNPREIYERAYGNLLQQDYASAEGAFAEFLAQFPNHELSGNAQYWLGESHYVRGQYRPAANAFLKGYQQYAKSQKAPDSLLKLGMSLDRLGQKDAACASFGELTTKFPSAPAHVQSRAQSERARLSC